MGIKQKPPPLRGRWIAAGETEGVIAETLFFYVRFHLCFTPSVSPSGCQLPRKGGAFRRITS